MIEIPENVVKIDLHAFVNCESLQKVLFSPEIRKIAVCDGAFEGCLNLREIVMPRCIADAVLNSNISTKYDSKKLKDIPDLKITYKE